MRADGPRPGDVALVEAMTASLAHRGPDGHGVASLGAGVLGHRRLAVVDLSERAAQPMASSDGGALISYNGEVYDHGQLRARLEGQGVAFRSRSDTEVVLAAWQRWGDDALDQLNGMFAFAIWDGGRLLLARDRYGQKPLYWARTADGGIAFASEVRALALLDELDTSFDRVALAKYLALDSFPGETTPYRGIRKLTPGTRLSWEGGRIRVVRYWRRRYGGSLLSPDAAAEELWRLLRRSVRRRLMSDVPLGVFLSGGIDSTAILAAMAAEVGDPSRIRTFAIGFDEASFDESGAARRVAQSFGVEHRELFIDSKRLLELVPKVLDHMDEPLADVSIVPTYALSAFAREHVTVALGGDGGDELFAGYDTFIAERLVRPYLRLPDPLRRGLEGLARSLPPSSQRMSLETRARRFVAGASSDPVQRNLRWFGSFLPEEAARLVLGDVSPQILYEDLSREGWGDAGDQVALDLWTRWYLPDDVLTKVDRASMAVSLEVRAPLLDHELASFAHGLPYRFKLRRLARKWIFKRALRGRVPDFVLGRRKQGFGAPNGEWLRGPLRQELQELLSTERLEATGILDVELARSLMHEHLSGRRDHRKRLWALYVLQGWLDRRQD